MKSQRKPRYDPNAPSVFSDKLSPPNAEFICSALHTGTQQCAHYHVKHRIFGEEQNIPVWPPPTFIQGVTPCLHDGVAIKCEVPACLVREYDAIRKKYRVVCFFHNFSCVKGHLIETGSYRAHEELQLTYQLAREVFHIMDPIYPTPPRLMLDIYGGTLPLEKFLENAPILTLIRDPPMLSCSIVFQEKSMREVNWDKMGSTTDGVGTTASIPWLGEQFAKLNTAASDPVVATTVPLPDPKRDEQSDSPQEQSDSRPRHEQSDSGSPQERSDSPKARGKADSGYPHEQRDSRPGHEQSESALPQERLSETKTESMPCVNEQPLTKSDEGFFSLFQKTSLSKVSLPKKKKDKEKTNPHPGEHTLESTRFVVPSIPPLEKENQGSDIFATSIYAKFLQKKVTLLKTPANTNTNTKEAPVNKTIPANTNTNTNTKESSTVPPKKPLPESHPNTNRFAHEGNPNRLCLEPLANRSAHDRYGNPTGTEEENSMSSAKNWRKSRKSKKQKTDTENSLIESKKAVRKRKRPADADKEVKPKSKSKKTPSSASQTQALAPKISGLEEMNNLLKEASTNKNHEK